MTAAAARVAVGMPAASTSQAPATGSAVSTAGRSRRVAPAVSMQGGGASPAGSSAHTSAPWSTSRWRRGQPRLGRFTWLGHYIPDLEAHRRWDAKVLERAHPAFHVWVGQYDQATGRTAKVCTFCGHVEPRRVAQVRVNTAAVISGQVWVIVDRLAAFDPARTALLAGPFWDHDEAVAATSDYTYSDVEPLRLRVNAGQFRTLARGGVAGMDELFSIVGPGCGGDVCEVTA